MENTWWELSLLPSSLGDYLKETKLKLGIIYNNLEEVESDYLILPFLSQGFPGQLVNIYFTLQSFKISPTFSWI